MDGNLEDEIDEQGRNLTQQRLDEEPGGDEPVDVEWSAPDDDGAAAEDRD